MSKSSKLRRRKRIINGLCADCGKRKLYTTTVCKRCNRMRKDAITAVRRKLKDEVFAHYGGYFCSCKNCPERKHPHKELLTINHIAGGGNQHRLSLGGVRRKSGSVTGSEIYTWLRKNNYPPGYNVLCWNCQWGMFINKGICPHNKRK